jgi:hypothetical protein
MRMKHSHAAARVLLGCIRLINGGLALVAPQFLCRNIGIDPELTPAALYVFRMFGIRTVLIATDLLFATGQTQARAIEQAPLIHASDTLAAALAAATGRLPGRSAAPLVVISAVNTVLALWARKDLRV